MFKMLFWKFFIDDNFYWYHVVVKKQLIIFINGLYLIFLVRFPNCYWIHFVNLQSCIFKKSHFHTCHANWTKAFTLSIISYVIQATCTLCWSFILTRVERNTFVIRILNSMLARKSTSWIFDLSSCRKHHYMCGFWHLVTNMKYTDD